jgi:hypothetical protein
MEVRGQAQRRPIRRNKARLKTGSEKGQKMITVKSTQKIFTEDEISKLTGICTEHLRAVARSKHLGSLVRAAGAAGSHAERWLFTSTELSVLTALQPRCEH